MTKKVLILSSSPRRGGNSDTLCDEFVRGAIESGNEAEKVFLRDKTIHYCTGCSTCSLHGKPCPQKDDAAEIIEKMVATNVIVMATPVYFYTMSAQMKTLIDRCCGLYTKMKNKEFYFIVTAAEDDRKLMERTVDTFQGFLNCLENPTIKGVVYGTAEDFITMLVKLQEACGVANLKMSDYGFTPDEFDTLATNAKETMGKLFLANPYELKHEDCVEIYRKSFH